MNSFHYIISELMRRNTITKYLSMFVALVGAFTIFTLFTLSFYAKNSDTEIISKSNDVLSIERKDNLEVQNITRQYISKQDIKKQLADLKNNLQSLNSLPKNGRMYVQFAELQSTTKNLSDRLDKLEQAILSNPAKALEIPLIQRDLENLRTAQQANLSTMKDGIDRIYDLNKWLLGAMAVSIITLAIVNFLKAKESK